MSWRRSSDEEEGSDNEVRDDRPKRKRNALKASLAAGDSDDDDDVSDGYAPTESKKKKKQQSKRKTKRRATSDDEDEDETEYQQEVEQEQAGASDSDDSVFQPEYDDDMHRIGDEGDRAYLTGLSELEREHEVFRRFEQLSKARDLWEANHKKKQKTTTPQSSSRRRTADRESKPTQSERRSESRKSKPKPVVEDEYIDDRDKDDLEALNALDEVEDMDAVRPVDMNALLNIRLSRNRLELWCMERFFPDVVNGCFVRLSIGANNGVQVYRLCQIVGVKEGQTYTLGKARTNFRLVLKHGASERPFRMDMISNSPFAQSEYEKWKKTLQEDNLEFPSMLFAQSKLKELNDYRKHVFSEEDIKYTVALKKKMGLSSAHFLREQEQSVRELENQQQDDDANTKERVQEKLRETQERARMLIDQVHSDIRGVGSINERNKQLDAMIKDKNHTQDQNDVYARKRSKPGARPMPAASTAAAGAGAGAKGASADKPVQHQTKEVLHAAHDIDVDFNFPIGGFP